MTASPVDLAAYFRRIDYAGPQHAGLDTLSALVLAHAQAIPFENLNPLLRLPVALDLPALQAKLINKQRGGYCYEHNLLLQHVLTALGFNVQGLLARVLWNVSADVTTPRSHMVLLITLNGRRYATDVGFGTVTPTSPLSLEHNLEQQTPHELFRYREADGEWTLEVRIQEEWRRVYCFTLQPQHQVDYEVANWYTSTHPSSPFLRSLIVGKVAPGRRYTLLNNNFAIHCHNDKRTDRRKLVSGAEIQELLQSVFGLQLPATPELIRILDGFSDPAEQTTAGVNQSEAHQ